MATLVSEDAFRQGMRLLAGQVSLVTTAHDSRRFGMTATAVCSVCAAPPTVLVCLNRASLTHEAVSGSGFFCVNVLGARHLDIAKRFGSSRSSEEKFDGTCWRSLCTGAPALEDAIANIDCRIVDRIAHGTHTVFLGEVVDVSCNEVETDTLIYLQGNYGAFGRMTA